MRLIDADALIEFCEERWIPLNIDAVNMQPTIQPEKEQLSCEGTTSDLISRQAVLDAIVQCTNCGDEDTLREYVLKHSLDNGWTGGILEALEAVKDLSSVQPEPHWIPVSERLPETEEFVLASLTGKHRNITFKHACEIADYADGEWCIYAYPNMSAEKCAELIEAWMPLPEAYKPNK